MGIQRDQKLGARPAEPVPAREPQAAVMAYFGDGASSEGDVHESMVFASSYNAPVVFFCQNNHWAISVPSTVQTRIPLSNRAKGYGFPGIRVDGNDVIAVHAVTEWALEHARQGKGPVLIEAFTYRVGAHTTADDPTKYRRIRRRRRCGGPRIRSTGWKSTCGPQGLADDAFFDKVKADGDELAAYVRKPPTTSRPRTSGPPSPTPTSRPTRWWPRNWPGSRSTVQGLPANGAGRTRQRQRQATDDHHDHRQGHQ